MRAMLNGHVDMPAERYGVLQEKSVGRRLIDFSRRNMRGVAAHRLTIRTSREIERSVEKILGAGAIDGWRAAAVDVDSFVAFQIDPGSVAGVGGGYPNELACPAHVEDGDVPAGPDRVHRGVAGAEVADAG